MHIFTTPLQRPEEFGNRRVRTAEEIAAAQASMERRDANYHQMVESKTLGMGGWAESTTRVDAIALTSLISYPENGRFPAMTARGQALQPQFGSSWSTEQKGEPFDSPQDDFDSWDRCITRGMPNSMLPFNYNNGIRIHQSPGFVVIDLEMIHESRIVPVDGRPALASEIVQWLGESRGRFEGDTLVIETTNFNGESPMLIVGPGGKPLPTSRELRIVERLRRTAADAIDYEIAVEDPVVLTQPWKAAFPLNRDDAYRMFEYACHEDNTAIRNFIETSRFERRAQQ
jgi:hypothetical protein